MRINQNLRSFLAGIDATHSISKTASQLFVTQPYISQTIHKYEQEFGTPLLARNKDATVLTYAGQRLLAFLTEEDQHYLRLEKEMANIAHFKTGQITIGTNQPLGRYLLPAVLPKFHQIYPDLQVRLMELPTDKAAYTLINDELDLFYGMPMDKKEITFVPIAFDPIYLAISNESPLFSDQLGDRIAKLKDPTRLDGQGFIMIRPDSKFQQKVDEFIVTHQLNVQTLAVVPDIDLATRIVHNHLGCTFSTMEALRENHMLHNETVNIYEVPTDFLRIDAGLSFKTATSQPIKDMMQLMTTYLQAKNGPQF